MGLFLILVGLGASIVTGLLYFFLGRSLKSAAVSLLIPMAGVIFSVFYIKDEFGFWLLALSLGLVVCLIGSALSMIVIGLLKK